MWIRLLLLVAIAAIALVLLRGGRGARHQAIRRLLLLGFVATAGLSVLFPEAWTRTAEAVGVGRGADLLLYGLIVVVLGFMATSYLRFRDLQRQVTELSRRLALDEAPAPRSLPVTALAATPAIPPARRVHEDALPRVVAR